MHDFKEGTYERVDHAADRAGDGLHKLRRESEDLAHRTSHGLQHAAEQVSDVVRHWCSGSGYQG